MRVRPLQDGDWPALAAFEAAHAGGALLTDRRLYDRFYRSPWSQGFGGLIAEAEDGAIDAVALMIQVPGKFGDRAVTMTWPAVLLASPRGQAQGAGAQLAMRYYRGFELLPSMNGTEQGNRLKDLLARQAPGVHMTRFAVVHRPEAAGFCRPERAAKVAAAVLADPGAGKGGVQWRWCDAIPDDYEGLWADMRQHLALTVERSRDVLAWRYLDFPYLTYRFLELRDGGRLAGFAVLRVHDTPKGPVCRIVDMVAVPGRSAGVWAATAEAAASLGACYSDFFMVGMPFAADLLAAGFQVCGPDSGLDALPNLLAPIDHRDWIYSFHLGGTLAAGDACWHDPARVYFTKGDCDRDFPTRYMVAQLQEAAS